MLKKQSDVLVFLTGMNGSGYVLTCEVNVIEVLKVLGRWWTNYEEKELGRMDSIS